MRTKIGHIRLYPGLENFGRKKDIGINYRISVSTSKFLKIKAMSFNLIVQGYVETEISLMLASLEKHIISQNDEN